MRTTEKFIRERFKSQKSILNTLSLTLVFLLIFFVSAFGQTGNLSGKITDQDTNEPIPFANIVVEDTSGITIAGTTSDFDGHFAIRGMKSGSYNIKATFVGYKTKMIKGVLIADEKMRFLNIEIEASSETLECVEIVSYCVPLISKDQTASGATVTASEIRKIRGARANAKAVNVNGIFVQSYNDSDNEEYGEIVENKFLRVLHHPLSTFSIDVDVASYSNIRRFLNQGELPPADAVRTEEMINYFTYDYPDPEGVDPIAIYTELASCDWRPEHKIALIGIQAEEIKTTDLPPNNLVFLLDVSGSMSSPDKLPLLKKSMQLLVNNLREQDKVAIVVYAGSSGLVLKPTSGYNKEKIMQAIENLHAGGSTAGSEGIKLAYETAEKHYIQKGNNRVILATDGDFNVGISNDKELVKLIEQKRESGIYLTVLGFGQGNLKDSKMEKLADHGNGNYAYIDNLLEAQKTLVSEMGSTLYTVAKDVKIQIEFNPNKVQAYRLIGYENRLLEDEDFNNDKKDAGEIGSGKSVTALYEIIPEGIETEIDFGNIDSLKYQKVKIRDATEFDDELLTVKVRYKPPKKAKSILITKAIVDEDIQFENASDDFRFVSSVAGFSMLLRNSQLKGGTQYDRVIKIAKNAKGEDAEGYRAEFIRLVRLAYDLQVNSDQPGNTSWAD